MTMLSTWLYPWDVADHGTPVLAPLLAQGDVDAVHVATSYHSLFASVPDNPRRQLLQLEQSALYVELDAEIWDGSSIVPTVSSWVAELGDARRLAGELAEGAGCAWSAWTVTLHDSGVARRAPDTALRTVWGGPVSVAPCLRHPAVRDFARRLVAQVAAPSRSARSFRPADSVQLESPCWTTLPHHRHAKLPAHDADVVARIAELCFCDRCRIAAKSRGIDVPALVRRLQTSWRTAHSSRVAGLAELVTADPELAEYLASRAEAVTGLVAELVSASPVPVEVVSFGDRARTGMRLADLESVGASTRVLAYGSPATVTSVLELEDAADDAAEELAIGLSLLPEHAENREQLAAAAVIAVRSGASSIAAYHLGLVDHERRNWLATLAQAAR